MVKTFADLRGIELITLANLALNIHQRGFSLMNYSVDRQRHPEKGHVTVIAVKLVHPDYTGEVRFGPVTGDIWRPEELGNTWQRVYNQWAIIGQCLKWGVDYLQPRPGIETVEIDDLVSTPFTELRDKHFNR